MEKKDKIIFIGDTHGFIDDFLKQKEVISSIKPEFVLCESLENLKLDSKERFTKILQKRKISKMTDFGEVEKLIKFCLIKKIKLIGIDLHNFGFNKVLQKKIKNQKKLTKEEGKILNNLLNLREKNHLFKILEYNKKTKKSIIVLLGSWHLREGSLLRKEIKDYKIILPCDKSGNPLFAPNNIGKIKYLEFTSKK